MSMKAAHAFRREIAASEELRELIGASNPTPERLARIAVSRGHAVTPEDVEMLLSDVELSDWEMEHVAGGKMGAR